MPMMCLATAKLYVFAGLWDHVSIGCVYISVCIPFPLVSVTCTLVLFGGVFSSERCLRTRFVPVVVVTLERLQPRLETVKCCVTPVHLIPSTLPPSRR